MKLINTMIYGKMDIPGKLTEITFIWNIKISESYIFINEYNNK